MKQLYRYTHVTQPGEESVLLEMIEDNGDRCMVRAVNLGLRIPPIENIARSEVEPVGDTAQYNLCETAPGGIWNEGSNR
jgi:hypothetical protein